jgi:hypothetical protein
VYKLELQLECSGLSCSYHFAILVKLQALAAKECPVVMSHVKLDTASTWMIQKKLHFVPAIHPIVQDAMVKQFAPFKKEMDIRAS